MNTALLLLPDFALILLGAALRRWMHLGDHFWAGVEKLVYFILFPALLVNAIIKTRLDLGAALPLLATAFAAMAGGMLLGLLPKLFTRLPALTYASMFQCACRFTENCTMCDNGGGGSKRQETKILLRRLKRDNPNIENSIFRSIHAVALDTMPGYKSEGVEHSFLERFHAQEEELNRE